MSSLVSSIRSPRGEGEYGGVRCTKYLAALQLIVLALAVQAVAVSGGQDEQSASSGTDGDLQWNIEGDTLTIAGTGPMPDHSQARPSWEDAADWKDVTRVIIGAGVTSVGNSAFDNLYNAVAPLVSVYLPPTVESIGDQAFRLCVTIKTLSIPNSVTYLGHNALQATGIVSLSFDPGTRDLVLGDYAICECPDLESVFFPDGNISLGDGVFYDDIKLSSVTFGKGTVTMKQVNFHCFDHCGQLNTVYYNPMTALDTGSAHWGPSQNILFICPVGGYVTGYGMYDGKFPQADYFLPPAGKLFSEYNTDPAGTGTSQKPGDAYGGGRNVYYATWMDVFTVQFENNGHGIEPADQIVPSGGLVTDPGSLTETGYTFGGWYEDAALTKVWDFAKHTVTANTTIYAKWAPHTYTVRFYSNGGSGAMEDEGFTYGVQQKLTPNEFTFESRFFVGWNTVADGSGIGFSDGQTVSDLSAEDGAVIALYAQWLEGPVTVVTVTFKANDGTQTQSDQVMVSGVETSLAANPFSRDGYAFFSWNTQPDGGGTVYADREEVTLTDGLVLYAMWVPNTYTVHFDANGGTGTMRDQEFAYGASQKLFKNAFERVDHEFAGWSTNADGTGKQFTDQQEVVNLTADAGDTVTLYAKWNQKPGVMATVTFDTKGHGDAVEPASVESGKHVAEPKAPSAKGYRFDGWYKDPACEYKWNFETDIVVGDMTLYAKWTKTGGSGNAVLIAAIGAVIAIIAVAGAVLYMKKRP